MSRILARALGATAGAAPVRPRLPTRFEPGLGLEPVREDYSPDGHGRLWPRGSEKRGSEKSEQTALSGTDPGYSPARPVLPPPWPASTAATAPAGQDATWPAQPASPARSRVPRPLPPSVRAAGQTAAPLADPASLADSVSRGDSVSRADKTPLAAVPPIADSAPLADSAGLADPAPLAYLAAFADEEPVAGLARPARRAGPPGARQAGTPWGRRQAGQENAEPVVRISIGRVEIRADRADEPRPRRQAARTRQPALELSEYLRRRDGQR